MKLVSAFATRRPWATVLVCLIGGPVVGMLYLAKGRNAAAYFLVSVLLSVGTFAAFFFGLVNFNPTLPVKGALVALHLVGAIHGYIVARGGSERIPRIWFSRWYVVAGLFIVFQATGPAVRYFLWQPFFMPSSSMLPTLSRGDYIFVSRFAYGFPPILGNDVGPERGDIVIFQREGGAAVVRRIVGLPGDSIQYRDGRLYVNDVPAGRERIGTMDDFTVYAETLPGGHEHAIVEISDDRPSDDTSLFVVPDGQYFGLGDNRDNSFDSRFDIVGFIHRENIVGQLSVVFWNSESREPTWETPR